MISGPTDIGHGVVITPVHAFDHPDVVVALNEEHDPPDSPRWTVESTEPLTLSPSLLCRGCGNHGWIREGRWVPA